MIIIFIFSVSTLNTNEKGESIYGSVNILDTDCSRQYLYCLKPQISLLKDPKMMHNATNIGKLDIVWRSNLGERGRLQTSQLQRMVCFFTILFVIYFVFILNLILNLILGT